VRDHYSKGGGGKKRKEYSRNTSENAHTPQKKRPSDRGKRKGTRQPPSGRGEQRKKPSVLKSAGTKQDRRPIAKRKKTVGCKVQAGASPLRKGDQRQITLWKKGLKVSQEKHGQGSPDLERGKKKKMNRRRDCGDWDEIVPWKGLTEGILHEGDSPRSLNKGPRESLPITQQIECAKRRRYGRRPVSWGASPRMRRTAGRLRRRKKEEDRFHGRKRHRTNLRSTQMSG